MISAPLLTDTELRNIVVTGGRGFIGNNLVRTLLRSGHSLRILDNLSLLPNDPTRGGLLKDGIGEKWTPDARLVRGDIRDEELAYKMMLGSDAVIHLAANSGIQQSMDDPLEDMDCNIRGTLSCLNAARRAGVKRFIFASSGAPLGAASPPFSESTLARPISPYGVSKLAGESYCQAYNHSFGLECVALRFANVYGPYSDHKSSLVGCLLSQAKRKEPWKIYGDGEQTRDFIYISDLISAIYTCMLSPKIGGDIFHIGSGVETSVNTIVSKLSAQLENAGEKRPEIILHPPRTGDMARSKASIKKVLEKVDWRPKVLLDEGLHKTVNWFLDQQK